MWKIRVRRLFSWWSVPGWLAPFSRQIYQLINAASNADWVRQHVGLGAVWAFLSAHSSGVGFVCGISWLSYLVVRPEQVAGARRKRLRAMPQTVTVFAHDEVLKRNPGLYEQVKQFFKGVDWHVEVGLTNLPQHSTGVWLHGGDKPTRTLAFWMLRTLNIAAQVDDSDDDESLQVIVGAENVSEREYDGSEITQSLAERQLIRDYPTLVSERDALKWALEQTQKEREALRGTLANERDSALQSLARCQKDFAMARVEWFAQRSRDWNPQISVTVRFADYFDYRLALQIIAILQEHAGWTAELDQSNKPVLKPSEEFKVVFESGISQAFDEIAYAFGQGAFLGDVSVGRRTADRHDNHLVIEVLPTVRA